MSTPKIKIEINKNKPGVELDKLASLSKETLKFLVSLSVDLNDPESDWIADNFENGSLIFELHKRHESVIAESDIWNEALVAVMGNDFSNPSLNVRIRPETRAQYFHIASALPEGEIVSFGVVRNGGDLQAVEWHALDRSLAQRASESFASRTTHYGEVQGIVHSFFKETKHPRLVIRELSTRTLVDCFFTEEMYAHAVALLQDRDGVVFVEGDVSEDASGVVTAVQVADFTPAPSFDESQFESLIGQFPGALTGESDAQTALDKLRENG